MNKVKGGFMLVSILVFTLLLSGCGTKGNTDEAVVQPKSEGTSNPEGTNEERILYLEGKGLFVRRIDEQSIEITIDKVSTVFQLTDEAQIQLDRIREGDKVDFFYSETDTEQKLLKEFVF